VRGDTFWFLAAHLASSRHYRDVLAVVAGGVEHQMSGGFVLGYG